MKHQALKRLRFYGWIFNGIPVTVNRIDIKAFAVGSIQPVISRNLNAGIKLLLAFVLFFKWLQPIITDPKNLPTKIVAPDIAISVFTNIGKPLTVLVNALKMGKPVSVEPGKHA